MSTKPDIQSQVLEKIRSGEVAMRPRIYFVAQIILLAILSLITLVLSLLVLSFILFSLEQSGQQFLLGFGARGFITLITLFPWSLLALVALLVLTLEWLVRSFRFGYRISVLRIFFGIMGVVTIGSLLLNATPLHAFLLDRADHNELPVIGRVYEQIHDPHLPQGVFRGVVKSVSTSTFVISRNDSDLDTDDGTWTILPPAGFDIRNVPVGGRIYVGGDRQGTIIRAYGVRDFKNFRPKQPPPIAP